MKRSAPILSGLIEGKVDSMLKQINHRDGVTSQVVTITPDRARAWLSTQTKNRKARRTVVDKYAADMARGDWQITGDAIRFDEDGALIDGQHRLMACIAANVQFETFVIRGLPRTTQDVMDSGAGRNAKDMLALHGAKSTSRLAASLRTLLYYRDNATSYGLRTYTNSQILEAFERHPRIVEAVNLSYIMPSALPIAAITFTLYAASTFTDYADAAQSASTVIATGIPAYDGDPIHLFREKCFSTVGTRRSREIQAWTFFRAWNAFANNEPMRLLRFAAAPVDIDGLNRKLL